jgi:hypothetical protein
MNKTINYCIATYEGISCHYEKYKVAPKTNELHKHMVRLADLIPSLKIPLSQITIIKPVSYGEILTNYYRIEEWRKLIPDVEIVVLDFDRPDLYSYGQWIHAYQNFPNFDYYITMEDDYSFDHVDFTSILLELFMKKVPSNIGYMSSFVSEKMHNMDLHSAISNGILSREAMERHDIEILKNYGAVNKGDNTNGGLIQYIFSRILFDKGVSLVDMASEYRALYWSDGIDENGEYFCYVQNFSPDKNVVDNLIVPTQTLSGFIVKNKYF